MNHQKHTVEEVNVNYEKAETELLRQALKRSHEERFYVMTQLMKRGIMLKQAKIIPNNSMKPQSP